jgi:hypothetical protein
MKKLTVSLITFLLLIGTAFALPSDLARTGSADLDGIKEVAGQAVTQPKTYEIHLYQTLPKKDGTGDVDVYVGTTKTTKENLDRQILMLGTQIETIQKRVTELQGQLDKINELEK